MAPTSSTDILTLPRWDTEGKQWSHSGRRPRARLTCGFMKLERTHSAPSSKITDGNLGQVRNGTCIKVSRSRRKSKARHWRDQLGVSNLRLKDVNAECFQARGFPSVGGVFEARFPRQWLSLLVVVCILSSWSVMCGLDWFKGHRTDSR